MSANMWGGLLLRTQAKGAVAVVKKLVDARVASRELFEGVKRLRFSALPKTRLTWVSLEPIDSHHGADFEALIEDSRPLLKELARALGVELWLIANDDYAGRYLASFDAQGKRRWEALDDRAWEEAPRERLERALAQATSARARRAAQQQGEAWLTAARARSRWGKLEAEAGLRFDDHVDLFGGVKRAAWRKTVACAAKPTPAPTKRKAPVQVEHQVTTRPPGAAVWMGHELLGNTPFTLSLPPSDRPELRLELPGHEPASVKLTGGGVELTMKPLALHQPKPSATVRFEVSSETRVWLDDVLVCRGPCELQVEADVSHVLEPGADSGHRYPGLRVELAPHELARFSIQVSMERGLELVRL